MSALGLGRVKTGQGRSVLRARSRGVSARDRGDQRLGSDDVQDPCQIVGQDGECHLCGDFRKGLGKEVCCSHASFHRAERMFDGLPALAHGLWVCVKALLHGFEQMLMLPSWNPPLWPCGALGFERTILTACGPVAPYMLSIFLARKAIWQLLAGRTAIGVFLGQIDKVLLAEAAI